MAGMPSVERNPYRPGAAVTPLFLAGRDAEQRRFRRVLASAPELPANVRLTGLRGVGKTVLLKKLESQAEEAGWATSRVQVEPRHNGEAALGELVMSMATQATLKVSRVARLRERAKGAAAAARGLVTVSYDDIRFSLSPSASEEERTVVRALFDVVDQADRTGHEGYLLMLDEAQVVRDEGSSRRSGEHPLSLLIAAVNSLQEQELPIGLVMCGLPTLRTNLLRARTYSERMFRGEEIGRLDPATALEAFLRPLDGTGVEATDQLADRVVSEVEGYPYFVQLWGAELWDAAADGGLSTFDVGLLDLVESDIYRRLDTDFYEGRVASLTPAEQDLLMVTSRCPYPPLRTADIHTRSGKTVGNVNVLMGRLAEQGVVYRIQKGHYEYTAPKFEDYLRRRSSRLTERGH